MEGSKHHTPGHAHAHIRPPPSLPSCYEIHGHLLHRELGFGDSEYVDNYLFAAIVDRLCISIIYKLFIVVLCYGVFKYLTLKMLNYCSTFQLRIAALYVQKLSVVCLLFIKVKNCLLTGC